MKKTTSIYLSDRYNKFIQEQIATGLYESASEVMRESLRYMEVREGKLKILREELKKGEDSGIAENFSFEKFLKDKAEQYKK